MAKKEAEVSYFELFSKMANIAIDAVAVLHSVLADFHDTVTLEQLAQVHAYETAGDTCKHQLMAKLNRDFITPIERDDLLTLSDEMDDVIDAVDDVLIKMYMYNVTRILPEVDEMMEAVAGCCKQLQKVMNEFADFRKSKDLQTYIIEMNDWEEAGDRSYIKAVRTLYSGGYDPIEVIGWTEIYRMLEKCCDTCEHVANVVSGVITKNT
ncbi:MAG: DUF47 family protein [Propionibacteriaceae bacterium]|jgi:predicted phosphate transport protein (TIGR00153 family)|nr:DUF47 family protein [Propionibacteriaceae bacterium]